MHPQTTEFRFIFYFQAIQILPNIYFSLQIVLLAMLINAYSPLVNPTHISKPTLPYLLQDF